MKHDHPPPVPPPLVQPSRHGSASMAAGLRDAAGFCRAATKGINRTLAEVGRPHDPEQVLVRLEQARLGLLQAARLLTLVSGLVPAGPEREQVGQVTTGHASFSGTPASSPTTGPEEARPWPRGLEAGSAHPLPPFSVPPAPVVAEPAPRPDWAGQP